MADETYVFGSFQLVPAQRLLLNSGRSLRLGRRALEILITLVECAGDTVSKDQLIGRVWPDTVVDEGALRVHVAAVRKALGDGREGNRFILSDPGRGYRFVAPVTREQRQEVPAPPQGKGRKDRSEIEGLGRRQASELTNVRPYAQRF